MDKGVGRRYEYDIYEVFFIWKYMLGLEDKYLYEDIIY